VWIISYRTKGSSHQERCLSCANSLEPPQRVENIGSAYDWAYGGAGWDFHCVLPLIKKSEDWEDGEFRGDALRAVLSDRKFRENAHSALTLRNGRFLGYHCH
jgi:hypothetical protein